MSRRKDNLIGLITFVVILSVSGVVAYHVGSLFEANEKENIKMGKAAWEQYKENLPQGLKSSCSVRRSGYLCQVFFPNRIELIKCDRRGCIRIESI